MFVLRSQFFLYSLCIFPLNLYSKSEKDESLQNFLAPLFFLFLQMLNSFKYQFAQLLAPHLPLEIEQIASLIVPAPDNVRGDLAFPCFQLAKSLWKAPNLIANDLKMQMETSDLWIFAELIAVGPYINASFDPQKLAQTVLSQITEKKSDFWSGASQDKTILLEGRAPNTHKSIHIGHVRNFLLSESIARILSFAGYKVIKTCYPGDIWAHVAKWIWYYQKFLNNAEFPEQNLSKRVGEIYTLATKKVDENPELYKPQIADLQKSLEDWDQILVDFWQKTRAMCLEDMQKIFAELGTEYFDKRYFESTVEQPGIQKVHELLDQGLAQKSQGAIVMNLEAYGLGVFLLLKSNGASLYSTKDIALAYQKKADFPNYDQSLYVVGLEQEHHFQQLFKTLDLIWFDQSKLHHVSYGLVDLIDGKMSSRAGNVVLYEDFRDQLLAKSNEMMASRDLPSDQKHSIAHQVAFGAMKFGMLLQDSEKGITFDRNQALSFEWESGPYLQYMGARISSILKKASAPDFSALDYSLLTAKEEKNLILLLASFPDLVQKSAQDYKPNTIARFALSLAKQFSSYYHSTKILDDQNPVQTNARLCLLVLIHQTLQNALNLLGIELPESM